MQPLNFSLSDLDAVASENEVIEVQQPDKSNGNSGSVTGDFDGVTINNSGYFELVCKANGRYYENRNNKACEYPI